MTLMKSTVDSTYIIFRLLPLEDLCVLRPHHPHLLFCGERHFGFVGLTFVLLELFFLDGSEDLVHLRLVHTVVPATVNGRRTIHPKRNA
mmetsp:Transcript_36110/g.35078  ORF Transcript_36110/g.35078 Transcript_36110/m.35078 type:complete len:89 (-) Transcript_36110:1582-1848(-)